MLQVYIKSCSLRWFRPLWTRSECVHTWLFHVENLGLLMMWMGLYLSTFNCKEFGCFFKTVRFVSLWDLWGLSKVASVVTDFPFVLVFDNSEHASEVQVTMMLTESCKLRGLHHRLVTTISSSACICQQLKAIRSQNLTFYLTM